MEDDTVDGPLFSKIWTYDELLTVERPGSKKAQQKALHADVPDPEWMPADTTIDREGQWATWLPEGWIQGVRTQAESGKSLKCYFSPERKRYWHKSKIEQVLGVTLESREPPKLTEDGEKAVKRVTDEDAIPSWPEEGWLPKDWRIAFRQLPSGLHRIFIPPGQDEGFLYHRHLVMEWLTGTKPNLSPFGSSKPMAKISELALTGSNPKKRKKGHITMVANPDDYEDFALLSIARIPLDSDLNANAQLLFEAGAPNPKQLATTGVEVHKMLRARGFPEGPNGPEVLVVFQHSRTSGSDKQNSVIDYICGTYYQRPDTFGERPYYQKVRVAEGCIGRLCESLHVFWSNFSSRWKIGDLDDSKAGWAFCLSDQPRPMQTLQPWKVIKESFYRSP